MNNTEKTYLVIDDHGKATAYCWPDDAEQIVSDLSDFGRPMMHEPDDTTTYWRLTGSRYVKRNSQGIEWQQTPYEHIDNDGEAWVACAESFMQNCSDNTHIEWESDFAHWRAEPELTAQYTDYQRLVDELKEQQQ